MTDVKTFARLLQECLDCKPSVYAHLKIADIDHRLLDREDVTLILAVMKRLGQLGWVTPTRSPNRCNDTYTHQGSRMR